MLVLTGLVQNKDRFPGELLPPIIENREEEQLPAPLYSWAGNTLPPKMHICNSCFFVYVPILDRRFGCGWDTVAGYGRPQIAFHSVCVSNHPAERSHCRQSHTALAICGIRLFSCPSFSPSQLFPIPVSPRLGFFRPDLRSIVLSMLLGLSKGHGLLHRTLLEKLKNEFILRIR